jgi:hypothetical protein
MEHATVGIASLVEALELRPDPSCDVEHFHDPSVRRH